MNSQTSNVSVLRPNSQAADARLISETYRGMNAQLHATIPDYGAHGHKWAATVATLLGDPTIRSVLDYGCGKGTLARALEVEHPLLEVYRYDPAMPEWAAAPLPADLVICCDVLEHIEPECLEAVLDDISRCAIRGCMLVIAQTAAAKTLPDGRNAHLIQARSGWWLPKLLARWDLKMAWDKGKDFVFIGMPK